MDLAGIALLVVVLSVGLVASIVVAKAGINMQRRRRKPTRGRRAKGAYQPPEPPEGRYWG